MLAASGRSFGWRRLQCPAAAALPWRDGGVYLITGGAGGLGLLFAEAIAKQARDTTLILTGRSALSEGARARLAGLPATGGLPRARCLRRFGPGTAGG